MDVLNVIYNCSDNILRQSLTEKLYLCRLSIPILLPDRRNGTSTFLLWALRSVVQDFAVPGNRDASLNTIEVESDITQTSFSLVDIRSNICLIHENRKTKVFKIETVEQNVEFNRA